MQNENKLISQTNRFSLGVLELRVPEFSLARGHSSQGKSVSARELLTFKVGIASQLETQASRSLHDAVVSFPLRSFSSSLAQNQKVHPYRGQNTVGLAATANVIKYFHSSQRRSTGYICTWCFLGMNEAVRILLVKALPLTPYLHLIYLLLF